MPKEITPDQEIWVMTTEGVELTGYSLRYLELLARNNLKLPEDQQLFKVRMRAKRYEIWLPDLLRYAKETVDNPQPNSDKPEDQEVWIMTTEAAEKTGYSREYLEQLARKNLQMPEDKRELEVRMRARRYELWLPDLLRYIEEIGSGPRDKNNV